MSCTPRGSSNIQLTAGFLLLALIFIGMRPIPIASAQMLSQDGEPDDLIHQNSLFLPIMHKAAGYGVWRIYCMGDSLTLAGIYEAELIKLLGEGWVTINRGESGESTPDMLARFQAEIIDPGDALYVIIWGGTNDIRWLPKVETLANLQAMYTMAHNAGIKVVAVTITPQNDESDPNKAKLSAINDWMRNSATDVDFVADAYASVEDPDHPGNILPAYDAGDHVHLSNAGYTVVARTIYDAVEWIPNPP